MDFLFSLVLSPVVLSPAAFAAFVAAVYWIYPVAILQGYRRFGGYLLAGLSRKFIEVGNIKYSYFEWKPPPTQSAPVTVLFIHGFSGCKTMWMVMAKYLPKEWHLVMLDMPGHGETSFNLNDDYSSTGLATKLNQFIDVLELTNVHLVGVSMGALVSAMYASLYNHKVKSITLMCLPLAHKLPNGVKTHFFQELEKGRILILPKDANQLKEMLELVLYNPSAYTFHYRLREAMVQIQMRSYKYMEQIMDDLVNDKYGQEPEKIKDFAKKITVPTLILWGKDDKICHPSGAALTGELIKNSRVVMVDKCGHAMTMDRPRKCAKLVKDFIKQQT